MPTKDKTPGKRAPGGGRKSIFETPLEMHAFRLPVDTMQVFDARYGGEGQEHKNHAVDRALRRLMGLPTRRWYSKWPRAQDPGHSPS